MRFLIAGSSGFLGQLLCEQLESRDHTVTRLVRRPARAGESAWDPYAAAGRGPIGSYLDLDLLEQTDVVVNLAGSPLVGNPHSGKWAKELRESRVTTTRVLAEAIAGATNKPTFVAGNGISWYGNHNLQVITEEADSRGDALLTSVTREWQAATDVAQQTGSRVVVLRTAPVLDGAGPPLKQLALLFRAGLGGPLGDGEQYFPVISARDWVSAVIFAAENDDVSGPVNLCCERVPTNAEFTKALGRAVHRPTFLRVPSVAIKVAAGQMAPEVLGSLRVVPQVLLDHGFTFADPDIAAVLDSGLAQRR